MRGRTIVALLALSLAVVAAGSAGAVGDPGFKTSQGSMLTQGDRADVEFSPIITVGETLGSYRFESIPDGISLIRRTQQKVDVYVNHETSLVAFPYVAAGSDGGELAERLRQLAAQPAQPEPGHGWRDPGEHGDHLEPELPAVLLELPGDPGRGVQPGDAVHERGGPGLGLPLGNCLDPADRAGHAGCGADRRRRWRTTCAAARRGRSTAWDGTTTRTTSRCPASTASRCSRATTRSRRRPRRRSSTSTPRRGVTRSGTTGGRCTRSSRTTRRRTTTSTCSRETSSTARSSPCRR